MAHYVHLFVEHPIDAALSLPIPLMKGANPMTAALSASTIGSIEVRLQPFFGPQRPSRSVYIRRRLLVGLLIVAFGIALASLTHSVLADRGGVPASTPAIRPAASALVSVAAVPTPAASPTPAVSPAAAVAVVTSGAAYYVVQRGDTVWSLASRFRAGRNLADYVDRLVTMNGGTKLQIGQALTLP